jgi:predicted nucleic-acid-binding Zn-ribbon protein
VSDPGDRVPDDPDERPEDGMSEPLGEDESEVLGLDREDEENVRADLEDLSGMRQVFQVQGVKGVVIACPDCGENHYYEWELLHENLEYMLKTGEPRMHEPAFEVREDEYIQWDYGKGYIDALADTGLEPDNRVEVSACPWCETPLEHHFQFCPTCGRSLGAVRLYRELLQRGLDEREVRAMLVRAGFEPF